MNKNLLVLSAAAASALAFSASAAVSSNIVGYVKIPIPSGYSLVSNPLNNTNPGGNKISNLFAAGGANELDVLRWNGTGFVTSNLAGGQVFGDDFELAPGESVFIFNAGPATSATVVGEALTGTQTVTTKYINTFVGSKIALSGTFTDLNFIPDGDSVSTWDGTKYVTYDAVAGLPGGYVQSPLPVIAVGQGLLWNTTSAVGAVTWSLTFTPAP